jgi:hypothetical protein
MSTGNHEIVFNCDSVLMPCDTITGVNWNSITGFTGPWNWLKNASYSNTLYPNSSDVSLKSPFNLTSPNFAPTGTSPIVGNIVPDFTLTKANNPFFDKVNYIGALPYNTGDWTVGWSNFDPNNTFYEPWICDRYNYHSGVEQQSAGIESAKLYPNPAMGNTTVSIYTGKTPLKITLTDMMGRILAEVYNSIATEGYHEYRINLQNMNAGVYNVVIHCDENRKNLKLIVQ